MAVTRMATLWLAVWALQTGLPPYIERGNEVEEAFRLYSGRLDDFFALIRETIAREAPELLPELEREDPPPDPGIYGYQSLPSIVDETATPGGESISTFSYSWPITERYLEGEGRKLDAVRRDLDALGSSGVTAVPDALRDSVAQYRTLVDNLETIDQYLQYNRLWQRAIAEDRNRFDRLTGIYDLLVTGAPGAADAFREFLGQPAVPGYLVLDRSGPEGSVLRLPVYTDIRDDSFLDAVETGVEGMWSVSGDNGYRLDIQFRKLSPSMLYPDGRWPGTGDHIDLADHVARFPDDGARLTTGAESTYGYVGDYVALGPGEITLRTLAHEFGHVLGFADGYIRGYRDLGSEGFEILELTSAFEDIMSAPREGRVLASHFELVIEAIEAR